MNNKKFLIICIPIFLFLVLVAGYGMFDTYNDSYHLFCWSKGMSFIKPKFSFGEEPVIKCRDDFEILCFDAKTKVEISCT